MEGDGGDGSGGGVGDDGGGGGVGDDGGGGGVGGDGDGDGRQARVAVSEWVNELCSFGDYKTHS